MIWLLRNIGVRLWITSLLTIPLGFYLIPGLLVFFPEINPLWFLSGMIAGIILLTGFLMDMLAKKAVLNLIKEGQAWEMTGINNKAEKKYYRALRLYDTFLIGVFSAKKTKRKISAAIARFKLNTSVGNENFSLATATYLKMNPADEDMAEQWLKQLKQSQTVNPIEQEVLTLLSETSRNNKSLSALITDIFRRTGRMDYAAKKMYLPVRETSLLPKVYPEDSEIVLDMPNETLEKQKPYSQPEIKPVRKLKPKKKMEIGKHIQVIFEKAMLSIQYIGRFMGSVFSFLILSIHGIYGFIKDHEKIGLYLKTGLLGFVSICLMAFIVNTVVHMVKPESKPLPDEKIMEKAEIPVVKPFSIQVAAYLKKEFADNYVNNLKKKGIEAAVKKVDGGGKTWFVVRVSEFADKKSADVYGQQLKQQKIIDDFFVTNK